MAEKYTKYHGSESQFQQVVARYLDMMGVLWWHTPNGGSRNRLEAGKLKREGVKAGVPDIFIAEPRKGYHGLFIELKVGHNKPTEHQQHMFNRLEANGYKVAWSNSLTEVLDLIDNYLSDS